MNKTGLKIKVALASPAPSHASKRFLLGFIISLLSMVLAALIYFFLGNNLAFDFVAEILAGAFVIIGVLVGWWMIKTGEKHAGLGIIFGSFFGIILIVLSAMLIALYFVAYPATGA